MEYKQIYDNIINYRLDNPLNGYTEKHHILPRSLGGNDDKSNLVDLSAREHYICHLLLTKIYPKGSQEYYKMVKAYNLMAKASSDGQRRDYKINANLYENLRLELSNALSISQSGCGNSQYKSFWVYNPSTLECKKVPSDFIIEDGWFKGRVTKWDTHYTQLNCIVCGKKGLTSQKSKTCTKECSIKNLSNSNKIFGIDENVNVFLKYYKETKSIRKALKIMGKVCGGNYHKWALKCIIESNDDEIKRIYKKL